MESREANGRETLVSSRPPQLTQPLLALPSAGDPETMDSSPNPALHMVEKTPLTSPGLELSTTAERERERGITHREPQMYVGRQSRDLLMRYDGKMLMTLSPASNMEWKAQAWA